VVNIFYLQLREYINEWRKQRGKEEEELKRLKDKQAKRKEIRYRI
jgi:troponin T